MAYKLGSLFDGSGGFPLAGAMCGIEPVWAAEVEPYPIAVTRSRFPDMKHLGDISKINGGEIEPVDIITFGSPCQDLSVAGKRAGLKHEANGDDETTRSGLFMEAVRIIKEMREATDGVYPRFALWENVPGAFSSNKGEDFRTVLEELIRIVEPDAAMPEVPKAGWNYADSDTGNGWSLSYRVFDAQYWGVPQRRRRIHLILDLRGECAGEVLFEREGLRGYFETGRTPWQILAADAQDSSGADDREGEGFDGYNGDLTGDVSSTLGVNCGLSTGRNGVIERGRQLDAVAYTLKVRSGCAVDSGGKAADKGALVQVDKAATLATVQDQYLFQPMAFTQNQRDEVRDLGDKAGALQAQPGMKQQTFIVDSIGGQAERGWEGDVAPTLKATHYKSAPCVTVPAAGFCTEHSAQARSIGYEEEVSPTLRAGVVPACVYDARENGDGGTVSTLTGDHENRITDYSSVVVGVAGQPVYCLQGNRIDRADTAGCNGRGVREDVSYTLNTIDRPAVAYCTDVGFFNSQEDVSPTLLARRYKDPHLVSYPETEVQYIVRRLTPKECARLQGFADFWGWIDQKDSFTDEEFQFWMEVRNTHAAINGKAVKDYTKAQMLTWYNKLWTDSSEYKMWGNGIALPPALYCMQGMVDAMDKEVGDSWML